MDIVLRDYQEDAVAAIQDSWDNGINRPAVVIATGGGKTTIFADLIRRNVERMRKEGKRILVLAHREELLEQAEARVKLQNPGIWTAVVKGARGQKTHQFADVVVASVQTLARPKRREALDRIGMIIVDECHNAASKSYKDVLTHFGCMDERQVPTVGFTATLTRMNGGLPEVWQSAAYELKIHQLIKRGYLVPPVAKSVDVGLNLATTRITGGDLNTKDLADAMDNAEAFIAIAETWCAEANDRPTIAFMPNVATAEKMAAAFRRVCGATAEVVTGDTPSTERRAMYERYNSGETRILVNCMVLTEGFDAPATSCVIIGRPTINPGLYIQMVGRGLRLSPGKVDCLVLDIAGASLKHNLAGVNDLTSDCEASCECNCLTCGCSDRCKCGIRECGCHCVEHHAKAGTACKCAGDESCGCGCTEDLDGAGGCFCEQNPECGCRGEGPQREDKEADVEVLKKLTVVDILGTALAESGYEWLKTNGGIDFLTIGSDKHLFLLPSPDGEGFFQGLVEGSNNKAPVQRLDAGALDAQSALRGLEQHADDSGYTYSNRKASWRRTKASEAQLGLLRRMRVEVPEGCKKGEASNLLSIAKVSRVLDSRFAKYVTQ